MTRIARLSFQLLIVLCLFTYISSLSLKLNHEEGGTAVQSNLKNTNWIYGTISEADLKNQIYKLMTSNNNILKCNIDFPFFDG
jgi:hypothetical protein